MPRPVPGSPRTSTGTSARRGSSARSSSGSSRSASQREKRAAAASRRARCESGGRCARGRPHRARELVGARRVGQEVDRELVELRVGRVGLALVADQHPVRRASRARWRWANSSSASQSPASPSTTTSAAGAASKSGSDGRPITASELPTSRTSAARARSSRWTIQTVDMLIRRQVTTIREKFRAIARANPRVPLRPSPAADRAGTARARSAKSGRSARRGIAPGDRRRAVGIWANVFHREGGRKITLLGICSRIGGEASARSASLGGSVAAASQPVIDGGPQVRLRSATDAPYDDAIAAARTCYSPRVVAPDEITERQRDSIGPLTYGGGHHTVFQHATFEFELSGVSRQLVWSVLHGFPFYNTEQQSQRYVKLGEPAAHVPPELGGARARGLRPRRSSARGRPIARSPSGSRRSRARSSATSGTSSAAPTRRSARASRARPRRRRSRPRAT